MSNGDDTALRAYAIGISLIWILAINAIEPANYIFGFIAIFSTIDLGRLLKSYTAECKAAAG